MIRLSNIGVKYDNWILKNVDMTIGAGEIVGLIGKSGIGKTSLIKVMAGLIEPAEGEVFFNDERVIGPSKKLIPGYEDIQLVNQDFGLEPYHSVAQNVKEKVLHLHNEDRDALVEDLLALVELDKIRDRKANLLSGGEQQRLAIARALACEPAILLLDEPFVHLDQRMRLKIVEHIIQLHEQRGITVVMISHDGSELMGFANRIIHLSQNGVERIAEAKKMFYEPNSKEQGELMGFINEVELKGSLVLFRPNEYDQVEKGGVELKYLHSIDTGQMVFNYFLTSKDEKIMLTADRELTELHRINIEKRG